MNWFFAEQLRANQSEVTLSDVEHTHLRTVLRHQKGDEIILLNGAGLKCLARIEEIHKRHTLCQIIDSDMQPLPDHHQIEIAISTIRPNRMDWALEKLVEIGVGRIQPLFCEYSSVRVWKEAHLKKVAVSALKQSQQTYLPKLCEPMSFRDWVELPGAAQTFLAHQHPSPLQKSPIDRERSIRIAIGPEGGFSEMEIALAESKGIQLIALGKSILRSETAAVVALASLSENWYNN